jgi:thiamine biosynthesis protein ThiS
LDGTVVPRSTHAKAKLPAGANVEIVHAIGGG